jgi:hypothetical protein
MPDAARPARRHCVFTSAGDRNAVAGWLPPDGARDFDLLVAFYGQDEARHAELAAIADGCWRIEGGKYQNLRALLRRGEIDLSPYSHVWVVDDDLILDPADVPRLFDLAARYDFHVCQPAFDRAGRISWSVTRVAAQRDQVRLTDLVEETCPLFRRDRLESFLSVYDGSLAGYGIDHWFGHELGAAWSGRFAVIDAITVVNPHTETKPGATREIERVGSSGERHKRWQVARRAYGIIPARGVTLATLPLPPGWAEANRLPRPLREKVRRLLDPAPGCVLCFGLGEAVAIALGAGAGLVVAVEADRARLAAGRARPAIARALRDGRVVLVTPRSKPAEAPWPVLAARDAWPDLMLLDQGEAAAIMPLAREAARHHGGTMPRIAMIEAAPRRRLSVLEPADPAPATLIPPGAGSKDRGP